MSSTNPAGARWFKSSYSNASGDCVEVAITRDRVAARDSKDPQGPNLAFTPEAWTAFVHGVARGDFPTA